MFVCFDNSYPDGCTAVSHGPLLFLRSHTYPPGHVTGLSGHVAHWPPDAAVHTSHSKSNLNKCCGFVVDMCTTYTWPFVILHFTDFSTHRFPPAPHHVLIARKSGCILQPNICFCLRLSLKGRAENGCRPCKACVDQWCWRSL